MRGETHADTLQVSSGRRDTGEGRGEVGCRQIGGLKGRIVLHGRCHVATRMSRLRFPDEMIL